MFNIFRMHMYRVSKATSTLVIGILLVAFLIFGLGMAHLVYNNPLNLDFQTIMGTTGVFGTFTASASHQFFIQGNDGFVILITIFAVILTNCDFTKGFAKNTYSMFEKRRPLVFAKWLALVACITGTYIVYSFVSLGLSAAVIKTFEFGSATEYFLGWLVVYICLISLVTVVFWITSLFKSPAGGMVIGVLIASDMFIVAESFITLLIIKITGSEKFIFSEYCLDYVLKIYNSGMGTADTVRTVIVALAYMALALTLSVFLSDKKDVKI